VQHTHQTAALFASPPEYLQVYQSGSRVFWLFARVCEASLGISNKKDIYLSRRFIPNYWLSLGAADGTEAATTFKQSSVPHPHWGNEIKYIVQLKGELPEITSTFVSDWKELVYEGNRAGAGVVATSPQETKHGACIDHRFYPR
jgi:hypothetical protein